MVRQFHPELAPWLDDNRILAQHAESRYIMGALERGEGMWFRHPETQRFYTKEAELRFSHLLAVEELTLRGYNHKTPMDGPKSSQQDLVSVSLDCFGEVFNWLEQDKADLFRKWSKEGRWLRDAQDESVSFAAGRSKRDGGFHQARRPKQLMPDWVEYRDLSLKYPHRSWTKSDTIRLRTLIEDRCHEECND